MTSRSLRSFLLGVVFVLIAFSSPAAETLNVFIWSEYIDPKLVTAFEKAHACKVHLDLYEEAESMLAKLQNGGDSLYDIVVPPDHLVAPMIKLNLLAPLRRDRIPNFSNLEARFINPKYDPGNRFTVPYQWGTVGLFVRRDTAKALSPSWGLVFDPALQPQPVVLIDSVRDLLGAALKYRGHSLNSTDPQELKAARDLVIAAKQRALGFDGSVAGKNRVLGRTARLAIVYSGEGVRGMSADTNTAYLIPSEGTQIWVDSLALPAHAPHRELAEAFINFMLEPSVGAQLSAYTQYATPNKAAKALLPRKDTDNPAIYPPPEVLPKLEFLEDLGSKTRLYDELWTQIKAR